MMQNRGSPLLDEVIQAVDVGVAVLDTAGRVLNANSQLREWLGLASPLDLAAIAAAGNQAWQKFLTSPAAGSERRTDDFDFGPLHMRATIKHLHADQLIVLTIAPLTDSGSVLSQESYVNLAAISDNAIQRAIELKQETERLEDRVTRRTAQLHQANMDAVWMLAVASEAKDQDTGDHVRRVQDYAYALARAIGIDEVTAHTIGISAILHDVGKIHVPDQILSKPDVLTSDERRSMQEHTLIGERILSRNAFFHSASQIARSHHENWDGSGYPDGLKGEAIPLEARIVHLADVYDALASVRVYKAAWPSDEIVRGIIAESGRMFDPALVQAFVRMIETQTWPHVAETT